ncbi:MAG: hypothetical protein JEZ07_01210 [Phycisphaerae bacterium]|nr:hypothetical protein [Phycisphaerae bacterium]
MKKISILLMALLVCLTCSSQADTISIAFHNGAATLLATDEVAGVVAVDNWNNIWNNGGTGMENTTGIALNDAEGNATGADLTYKVGYTGYNSLPWGAQVDKNYKMMEGWFGMFAADAGHYTISNLPGKFTSGYDVYIYFESGNDNRTVKYTVNGQVDFGLEVTPLFNGTFTQASGTEYANATGGNYLLFENVTGADLIIEADALSGRAACQGIQIVSKFGANNPIPDSGASDVPLNQILSWSPSEDPNNPGTAWDKVESFDVYFGEDFTAVQTATTATTGIFKGNQALANTSYTPTLDFDGEYFWRIDEKLSDGSIVTGTIWDFKAIKSLPVIITEPIGTYAPAGGTAMFEVVAESLSPLNYTWFKFDPNNPDVEVGDDSPMLEVANVTEGGFYYCLLENDATTPATAVKTVNAELILGEMIAHWALDDTFNDASGNGFDGTSAIPGEFVDGIIGKAYEADVLTVPGNNIVVIPDTNDALDFYINGFSFTAWVNTTAPTYAAIASKQDTLAVPNNGWIFNTNGGGVIALRETIQNDLNAPTPVNDGQWHFVVGQYDAFTSTMRVYVDGKLDVESDQAIPTGLGLTTNDVPVILCAASEDGVKSPFVGMIDDVRMYNYPLSAYEVADMYTDIKGGWICVDGIPEGDLNGDCIVNLEDFAILSGNWMGCNIVPASACTNQ